MRTHLLATTAAAAALLAAASSTRAQTNWTGTISSDWPPATGRAAIPNLMMIDAKLALHRR